MSVLPPNIAVTFDEPTERVQRAAMQTQPERDLAWYQERAVELGRENARLQDDLDEANDQIADLRRQLGVRLRLVVKR